MKEPRPALAAVVTVVALGLAIFAVWTAWHLPVRWRSLHPQLLAEAGRGTPQLEEVAWQAILAKKPGVAGILYEGGTNAGIKNLGKLATALREEVANPASAVVLGTEDPNLLRLFPAVPVSSNGRWLTALEAFLPG